MTDDRFLRRLPGLMDELAGDDDRYVDEVLVLTARVRQRASWTFRGRWLPSMDIPGRKPLLSRRVLAVFALLAVVATLVLVGSAALVGSQPQATLPSPTAPSPTVPTLHASNGWIAVSTGRGDRQEGGSDIYLVHEGAEPRLIVQRDSGGSRNVCPAFSPDGTKLAYGTGGNAGWAVVVLGVDANGTITGPTVRLSLPAPAPAPCPRWSLDGTRVAYLYDGVVVVRGLDGSSLSRRAGDPRAEDFDVGPRNRSQGLLAPPGDRVAHFDAEGNIVVPGRDGSPHIVVANSPCYALGAWSPDGETILCMQDVGGGFAILAMSVDGPSGTITIASNIPVNTVRAPWPGIGDVSWQPIYP